MNKITRYAIHKTIVAILLSIPLIFSCDTLYKLCITKELPDKNYEVVADGVITDRFFYQDRPYFRINSKAVLVENSVFQSKDIGDSVRLTIETGPSGWTGFRFLILGIVTIAFFIGLIVLAICLVEEYFKWLKGDDE